MGRFPQDEAKRGSQKWLQKLVNDRPEILNSRIWSALDHSEDERVEWRSPLKSDDYAEYRDQAFLDLLDVELEKAPLTKFWPERGPQWDGLGKSSSGKLFLLEAKSHISELISSMQAENDESTRRIKRSLEETKDYYGVKAKVDWSQTFYQYTNRLAHLCLLRRKNNLPTYLIYVYFLNDVEMTGPTTDHEWKGALKLLHSYLGIGEHKLEDIIDVFVDTRMLL